MKKGFLFAVSVVFVSLVAAIWQFYFTAVEPRLPKFAWQLVQYLAEFNMPQGGEDAYNYFQFMARFLTCALASEAVFMAILLSRCLLPNSAFKRTGYARRLT